MYLNREEQIRRLLEKYEQQACSAEELQQLHEWLEEKAAAGSPWEFADAEDRQSAKHKMQAVILSATGMPVEQPGRAATIAPWLKYAAVAAGILLCVWGIRLLTRTPAEIIAVSEPGKIKALVLPDGSRVWLNDNSELAYHSDFAAHRNLELRRGEAFFDVQKDPAHVFTVWSHGLATTVLGTSFSARTIGGTGDLKVTVVTGKVMVSRQTEKAETMDTLGVLLPYQRLRYNKVSGRAVVDSVLTGEADGWIRGDIFLQNASLAEVIQWLQDHFKVNVNNKRHTYTGEYYLQAKSDIPLPEVLKILNLLGKRDHVQFSLQQQTIIIQ